ncbi:AMP-binding protein [Pseudomonas sp. AA-38]|uniref:AMP-binding protein n=1 Tax=Pseudomonas sp. AA-38 TaxID=3028807 RepID=UPI0023F8C337|nr:AMP-binding protein [Pseudomonas sp. AA-38]
MGAGATLDYAALLAEVRAVAQALAARGIQRHDCVAILLPFVPQAVTALIAATCLAVAFPVNLLLSAEALRSQLALSGCRAVISMGPHPALDVWERLQMALDGMRNPPEVIAVSVGGGSGTAQPWDELLAPSTAALPANNPERVGLLIHTGGTTGLPKLARLSLRNMASASLMAASGLGLGTSERLLSGLPLFHVGGAIDALLATLSTGATLVFPSLLGMRSRKVIDDIWKIVDAQRITLLAGVPTTLAAIAETSTEGADLHELRALMTGGSPLPQELFLRLQEKTGKPVCQLYGMTESSGIATAQRTDGRPVSHSTGKPVPNVEICLGSPDSGFHPGARGEILVRGPNVFKGYLTAEGIMGDPNGSWLYSGDLGEVTAAGELRVVGRAKDVIIRSGHNIDPQMIEDAALAHPGVLQAAAVGMPDDYAGEVPVLYLVPRAEAALALDELMTFIAARIAEPPARPRHVFMLDELPLTPFAKVARFRLRQLAVEYRANEIIAGLAAGIGVSCDDPAAKEIQLYGGSSIAPQRLEEIGRALARFDLRIKACDKGCAGGDEPRER